MEIAQDLLEKVMSNNAEFKKLYNEHNALKHKVEDLNKLRYLTPEQELEKKKIQKQKLSLKDRMNQIVEQYQATLH